MVRQLSIALPVIVASFAGLTVFLDSAVPEPKFSQARVDGASPRSLSFTAIYVSGVGPGSVQFNCVTRIAVAWAHSA